MKYPTSNKFGRKLPPAPQSGVSMTVTGLRLSTSEIVADYLKGRRPMSTPSAGQFDESDEPAGFQSSYYEHEYLQRVKSEAQTRVNDARQKLLDEQAAKDARLAELEAHFAKTGAMFDPEPAPPVKAQK
jgi:hypothetical protein